MANIKDHVQIVKEGDTLLPDQGGDGGSTVPIHHPTHEAGGKDEIDVTDLQGLLSDYQKAGYILDKLIQIATPTDGQVLVYNGISGLWEFSATPPPGPHKTTHETGGIDEIDLTDLYGETATPQTPKLHGATHENGGTDEINVTGLSGELADGQVPKLHGNTHNENQPDELKVEQLGSNAPFNALFLANGAGGVVTQVPTFDVVCPVEPDANYGYYRVQSVASNGGALFRFKVPSNFVTLVSLQMIGIPSATFTNQDVDLDSNYAAIGQNYLTHVETNHSSLYSGTINLINAWDISSVFSQLAAGDCASLYWKNNAIGATLYMLGLLLRYQIG